MLKKIIVAGQEITIDVPDNVENSSEEVKEEPILPDPNERFETYIAGQKRLVTRREFETYKKLNEELVTIQDGRQLPDIAIKDESYNSAKTKLDNFIRGLRG